MVPPHDVGPVPGAPPHLAAHIARDGDASVIRVRGELSGQRVPLLETVIRRLEKRGDARLIVDLRDIMAIDDHGAEMLRQAGERVLAAGRSMTVLGSAGAQARAPAPGAPADG
jgi:anti-anti-sigma regulatory factor